VFIQAPKSRKYDENIRRGKKISLYLLQKDISKQLKTVIAEIIIIIAAIMETINNDRGISIEIIKNDEGMRKKIKIANTANFKNIFLSRINIFIKTKKYIAKTIIADINIIRKPKRNNLL